MYPYENAKLSPAERTKDLLSRMTVKEKLGQLVKMDGFRSYERNGNQLKLTEEFKEKFEKYPIGSMYGLVRADWWTKRSNANGITPELLQQGVTLFRDYVREHSRLHIPLYVAEEAPHGLMSLGSTVFPTGLGLGAMFDVDMLEKVADVIGTEAKASGVQSIYGPVLDLAQDPRWSRTEEDYSEDPYLVSRYGERYVKTIWKHGISPTLKHFAAHGSPEGGHNTALAHVGINEFFNIQSRPFQAAIKAGAKSLMSAYNIVDGEPCSGSHYILTDILRDKFGFDGFVVSDRAAIRNLVGLRFAEEEWEASALALKAGCDVDELDKPEKHFEALEQALEKGLIDESDLDRAAGRILKLKFEMGLFDDTEVRTDCKVLGKAEHRQVALDAARKSMTLLKNNGILPLKGGIKTVAVIGPNADNVMNQLGDYTAPQLKSDVVTVLDGVKKECAPRGINVTYAQGCRVRHKDTSGFAEAVEIAKQSDIILLVLGGSSTKYGASAVRTETGAAEISCIDNSPASDKESGEGTDRATLCYSGVQPELYRKLRKLGKPVAVILIQGRPLDVSEFLDSADAVLCAWYPGMCGGTAVAETLFGKNNPAGRLPVSLPLSVGQLPVYYYGNQRKRRDYNDLSGQPLLPFGFGLSYTTFAYSGLCVNGRTASVQVRNTGNAAGEEVVQFYLTDKMASMARPEIQLCYFERIALAPGETKTVTCRLGDDVLGFYNRQLQFVVEPGTFILHCGSNCVDTIQTEFKTDADRTDFSVF